MPPFYALKIYSLGKYRNKRFLLFSQCFLAYVVFIFHFKRTLKCHLRFVSIWTSLKFLLSCKGLTLYHTIPPFNYPGKGRGLLKTLWEKEKMLKRRKYPSLNRFQFFGHIYFTFILSSANAVKLDWSKILSFGKELMHLCNALY